MSNITELKEEDLQKVTGGYKQGDTATAYYHPGSIGSYYMNCPFHNTRFNFNSQSISYSSVTFSCDCVAQKVWGTAQYEVTCS